jgi:hypothetical protein
MSDDVTTRGRGLRAGLAAAIRDESGAARHDRLLLLGGGAVLGALVLLSWMTEEPPPETAAGGAVTAQAPMRSVTSSRTLAPEPPPPTDADGPRGYVSADLPAFQLAPPDTEGALLEALTDRARAEDAAAFAAGAFGDAPSTGAEAPSGSDTETVAETEAVPDGT